MLYTQIELKLYMFLTINMPVLIKRYSFRNESTIVYCQNVTAGDIAQQYLPTSQVSSVEDESDENDSSEVLENEMRSSRIDRNQTSQEGSSENTFRELFMSG